MTVAELIRLLQMRYPEDAVVHLKFSTREMLLEEDAFGYDEWDNDALIYTYPKED